MSLIVLFASATYSPSTQANTTRSEALAVCQGTIAWHEKGTPQWNWFLTCKEHPVDDNPYAIGCFVAWGHADVPGQQVPNEDSEWGGECYNIDTDPSGANAGAAGGCDGGEGGCPSPTNGAPMDGDPVNTATGNKYIEEEDYTADAWLTFRRFYNSDSAATTTAMGLHWGHSFTRKLSRVDYDTGNSTLTAFRPNGLRELFRRPKGGTWNGDPNNADTLSEIVDAQGHTTGYLLRIAALRHVETYSAQGFLLSISDRTGQTATLTYSDASSDRSVAPVPGLLMFVTAPGGRQLSFAYDGNAHVRQVLLPNGRALTYAYDSYGDVASVTYPDGKTRQYLYNEPAFNGGANLPAAVTGIIDENGARYESTSYDSASRAAVAEGAGGAGRIAIKYNDDGSADVTYPLGQITHRTHTTVQGLLRLGSLDKPCGSCGQPYAARTYDTNSYPATYTDFRGAVRATTYDSHGLLTRSVDAQSSADERTTDTVWNTDLRVPLTQTMKNHAGDMIQSASWSYNARGQVTFECTIDPGLTSSYTCGSQANAPSGIRQTRYTYCDAVDTTQCPLIGLLLSTDGPRTDENDITRMRYYLTTDESGCGQSGGACHRAGDLYQTVDAAGHTATVLAYDKAGRIVRQSDANGVITDLAYTPRGWLTRRTVHANADGSASNSDAVTIMAYDPTGTLHSVTDPDNVTVTYGYDDAHRLTDITDGQGNRIHYTLDAAGNRTREETFDTAHTLRRSVTRTYNNLGQLITTKDGLGQTVFDASANGSYDANGNLVQSRGALGAVHQDVVDALNRVVTSIDNANGADIATQNTTNQYVFDALDRLTAVTDPDGLTTHYGFDGLGNSSSLQSPDTGSSSATFDTAGNTLTKVDAKGITVTNSYDALNRLVSASYADTRANAAYHYDEANSVTGCATSYPQGRLTRVVESAVTTTFCYDFQGQVTEKRQTQGTVTDTVSYVHTRAGRLAAIGTPSGAVTEYNRDALGQIISVTVTPAQGTATPVVTTATYLPFGPIASYTLGNGQTITRTYDANYRATDVVSPALNLHFARDAAGNIVALGDAAGANPASETYRYDALYRLTSVNDPSGSVEAYTYNKTGDRLSKTAPGSATGNYQYQPGTHWLTAIGTTSRVYDANGSMTGNASAGATWGYGYDSRGRLSVVQQGGQAVATYIYDAFGERISKTINEVNTRFVYGDNSELIAEYGSTSLEYIWMGTIPVAVHSTNLVSYIHADALDSPRAITDGNATLWRWVFNSNPFGETSPVSTSGYKFNLRFPGQYFDVESGLADNLNRTYDPTSGRFVQSDPLGLSAGNSTYGYANVNPLSFSDASGLQAVCLACHNGVLPGFPGPVPVPPTIRSAPSTGTDTVSTSTDNVKDVAKPDQCPPDKHCPPCKTIYGDIIPVGTIGFRFDSVPPSKPHWPFSGSHYHIKQAHQNPNNCRCFWVEIQVIDGSGGAPPPPGLVPAAEFVIP
ncbi:RHS repeat-associated core domain-containing protein [Luteibacter sp.]|uniref:RHS repeat-associated core domain-containing protein n=1 Tax=Luteibacter sp. TaxID=1886636 RepID=UPI0025C2EB66|nr:RHS repeat-associated core domain-containing protein [Luteibacter sp.]